MTNHVTQETKVGSEHVIHEEEKRLSLEGEGTKEAGSV